MTRPPMQHRRGFTVMHLMWVFLCLTLLLAAGAQRVAWGRRTCLATSCRSNLRRLASMKEQWVMDHHAELGDTPTAAALQHYTKGILPTCPDGGVYTIGTVAAAPQCSLGGRYPFLAADDHVLSAANQQQFSGDGAVRAWKEQ